MSESKHYYAIAWHYGRASNQDGSRCGTYFRFRTREDRDKFISGGSDYTNTPDARETIKANDRDLRRAARAGEVKAGKE